MHSFFISIISNKKKGLFASFCRAILFVLSGFYGLAIVLRPLFLKKPYRPKAFTISIGNIVAGGTGKTPFTIFLASLLGDSVSILMRGYKSQVEDAKIPFMFQARAPVSLVGDEAALIAKNVPYAKIFCSKNKAASSQMADGVKSKFLLIDDGFQHRALARDLDIVMLDAENPFGFNYLLPRGLLREPKSALKRADLIVITSRNGNDMQAQDEEEIRRYSEAPICRVRFSFKGLFDLQGGTVDIPVGTKVGIFCAIAKPEQFVESIRKLGLEPVYSKFHADHAAFSAEELQGMMLEAEKMGARWLITTEKDMVKLSTTLPICWLKVGIEMMTPSVWEEFLSKKLLAH